MVNILSRGPYALLKKNHPFLKKKNVTKLGRVFIYTILSSKNIFASQIGSYKHVLTIADVDFQDNLRQSMFFQKLQTLLAMFRHPNEEQIKSQR